jgi:hypothetical protein
MQGVMKEIREKHAIKTDGRAFIVEQELPGRGKEKRIPSTTYSPYIITNEDS